MGAEGKIIDDDTDNKNNGHGDMSPSLSGDSSFTVAAWIRLFEDLEDDKKEGEALSAAEQKHFLLHFFSPPMPSLFFSAATYLRAA